MPRYQEFWGELKRFLIASAVVVLVVAVGALVYHPTPPPVVTPARGVDNPVPAIRWSAGEPEKDQEFASLLFDYLARSAQAFNTGNYDDDWLVREASPDLLARESRRAEIWTAVYPGPLPTVVLDVEAFDASHGTITVCSLDQSRWALTTQDAEPTTEGELGRVFEYTVRPSIFGGEQFIDVRG